MKYIKYISLLLFFFLVGMIGVNANSEDLLCKYTIKCSDIVNKFDVVLTPNLTNELFVYSGDNKPYSFKVNNSDYVFYRSDDYGFDYRYYEDNEYRKYPKFCGNDDSSGTSGVAALDIRYFVDYFNNKQQTDSNCPVLKLYLPDEGNVLYAFANNDINTSNVVEFKSDINYSEEEPKDNIVFSGCIIDPGIREIIDWIMNLVRFVGIVLLIVLGMLDFIKAAASGEQEVMKKSKDHFIKRLIACVLLFLAPIFVDILLSIINITGGASEECNSKVETTEKYDS